MPRQHPATIKDIYAALVVCNGHRGAAAAALGMPLRTLHNRLREGGQAVRDRLDALAAEHGWPAQTDAAHEASQRAAAARRAARLVGA